MWTDKQIIEALQKGFRNFGVFTENTKIGYIILLSLLATPIILIVKLIFNYFGVEYEFMYGMLGMITTAILFALFDSKHKDKKWW